MSLIQVGMLISLFLFCSSAEDEYFPVVITSLLVGNISFFSVKPGFMDLGLKIKRKGVFFLFFFLFTTTSGYITVFPF